MNLVLDIGNTRHKLGLFDQATLLESRVVTDWTPEQICRYGAQNGVSHAMISNVAASGDNLQARLSEFFDCQELTHQTPLPFENRYATPATLGKDRLAAVAGARALLPGQHCLVIDCGTCIKYDLMTAQSAYLGGNIAPGLTMRTKAMHDYTARLPEVTRHLPASFCGISTETALQNGAFRGALLEIEGFIALFMQQFTPLQIILTGGDAVFIQNHLNNASLRLEPHLTLHGLNHLLQFNRSDKKQP